MIEKVEWVKKVNEKRCRKPVATALKGQSFLF